MFSKDPYKNSYKPLANDASQNLEEASQQLTQDGRRIPDLEHQIPEASFQTFEEGEPNRTHINLDPEYSANQSASSSELTSSDSYQKQLSVIEKPQFRYQDFVPYQLSDDNTGLFPEFYFHFKRSFSALSSEHNAYLILDATQFRSLYDGTEQGIENAILRIENEYESKFRQCLSSELHEKFVNWRFTRACVESQFRQHMIDSANSVAYPRRLDSLLSSARSGEIRPLLDFFEAFDFSEEDTWHYMLLTFSRAFTSDPRSEFLNSTVELWQQANGPLSERVDGFVQDLRREGMNDGAAKLVVAVFAVGIFVFLMAVTRGFSRFGFHGPRHH